MRNTTFNHEFMSELNDAESREFLLTSGTGAYSSSTICGCNMRKYHGVFVCRQPAVNAEDHVLISTIDEDIIYKENSFETGTHRYPGVIHPSGFRYISEFGANPLPKWIYVFDDCVMSKEYLMPHGENVLMVRYEVLEATEKLELNISPFAAFRCVHDLRRAGFVDNKRINLVENGVEINVFQEYDKVFMQTSVPSEFIVAPDWYYNIEYPTEQQRGYPFSEDLFVPGHFNLMLKKGDQFVLQIGLEARDTKTLAAKFTDALKSVPDIETNEECIKYASQQFIIEDGDDTFIKAGYHWFGCWGRDTFISMPGLLLTQGETRQYLNILRSSVKDLKNGLLPNVGRGENAAYNSADASLWFVWAVQQYTMEYGKEANIWKEFGPALKEILESYKNGTSYNIHMDGDGLITAGHPGVALTWMDAIVNGMPVTPRNGKAVDINAMWYNAICYCLHLANVAGDTDFIAQWQSLPAKIAGSFVAAFWNEEKNYLADCVLNGEADWSMRPNQVFALSMPFSPVTEEIAKSVLNKVESNLLTSKGLRTLSQQDPKYKGICEGSQENRDNAYHQGTVWPWLLGHFTEAYVRFYGEERYEFVYSLFGEACDMFGDACLNTVPEIYDGDYPHKAAGAVAQAWSVGEISRMEAILKKNVKGAIEK